MIDEPVEVAGPPADLARWRRAVAGTHLLVSVLAGGLAAAAAAARLSWVTAGLIGWVVAAGVFLVWTWASIWSLGPVGHRLARPA